MVGEYIRFKSSIPLNLNEFAILITAREWDSQMEWYIHYPIAMKAGLSPKIAADLQVGNRPAGMSPDEVLIYDFSTQMHRNKANISDALYKSLHDRFGDQGVVDLVALNGYYTLVAMTLNLAQVELPRGEKPPLQPVK